IGRSFQNTNLFETLTVAECLMLARWRIDGASLFSRRSEIALPRPAVGILEATGLDKALTTETRNLSHGQKRGLELAMVLATEPSVLLLDEPTAGLTKAERTAIGDVLTALAKGHGLSILLIEHDLDFVRDISDRIVVLHQGALLMEGTVEEVIASELVKAVYSGQSVETAS
ncbi:MAG: ATP-binding cassette domain-containing protein, partial [Pseudomonadota bacterium]